MASAAFVNAQDGRSSEESVPPPSDMGVICWAAIVEIAYQVASRCDLGEQAASKETLSAYADARSALADRLLANGWEQDGLDRFRAQQGSADASTQELCKFDEQNDTGKFLLALAQENPETIMEITDSVLAIPGPPRWGTCL